jgi:uncharacterized protein (TIGR02687 family)
MSTLNQRLTKLFHEDDHRIVLWYGNDSEEMAAEFGAMALANVTKLDVQHKALKTKFTVMVERTDIKDKFLLFSAGKVPENDAENWLLDLQLAFPVFSTDEYAVYRDELKLDRSADLILETHRTFFASKERRDLLAQRLPDTVANNQEIELGMLGAILRCPAQVTDIFLALISAYTATDEEAIKAPARKKLRSREEAEREILAHNLEATLWEYAGKHFGYESEEPSVEYFIRAIFVTRLAELVPGQPRRVRREGTMLLNRWQESERMRPTFERTARRLGKEWNVEMKLKGAKPEEVKRADAFVEIDQCLLRVLRDGVLNDAFTPEQLTAVLAEREGTFWADYFTHHYAALRAAATFFALQRSLHLRPGAQNTLSDYTQSHYKIDVAYREFYYHLGQVQDQLLHPLIDSVESRYTTGYLHPLNQHWQQQLDAEGLPLDVPFLDSQRNFWRNYVLPYAEKGNRIFVIISDALRYESGASLNEWLPTLGRYRSELTAMMAAVPTFTQLGMAALLPHRQLELNGSGQVFADGKSTQGTAARDTILKAHTDGRAVAITAQDFMRDYSARDAGRAWVKGYDVVYIYHNIIDQAGEKEEDQLFLRTHACFEEIDKILNVITRMNGNNIFITADHGYLFQQQPLVDSDYASYRVEGDNEKYNRRFVLGQHLEKDPGAMHFTAADLRLAGELEVVIPRSVHRLRRSGSGGRYVHGGTSLQELLVPLLKVGVGRTNIDDIRPVEVEVIAGNGRITANRYGVRFYQKQAVGGKRSERRLRIGFYNKAGKLISDEQTYSFGSTDKEERLRETRLTFEFTSDASAAKAQDVSLRLSDPAGAVVLKHPFTLHISFANDFDDM